MLQVAEKNPTPKLYVALELSDKQWVLALSDGEKQSLQRVPARDLRAFEAALAKFRERRGLPSDLPALCVYEAGPDGFSVARALRGLGHRCLVIDSASIEQSRHHRRKKTDNLDARSLLRLLIRYDQGDKAALKIVREPDADVEDLRNLQRERTRLSKEFNGVVRSLSSRLKGQGIKIRDKELLSLTEEGIGELRTLDGRPVEVWLKRLVLRGLERARLIKKQRSDVEATLEALLSGAPEETSLLTEAQKELVNKVILLKGLKGIGPVGGWVLVNELLGWRKFNNRKEVGAAAGLTPTPYNSGSSQREQGISKIGNARVRSLLVELSWLWLRHQPDSEITQWYHRRWTVSGARSRRIGITAVARKLLIALWRFVDQGVVPQGAVLKA